MSSTSALVHSSHSPWAALLRISANAVMRFCVSLLYTPCFAKPAFMVPNLGFTDSDTSCLVQSFRRLSSRMQPPLLRAGNNQRQASARLAPGNRRKPLLLLGFECRTEILVHSHPSQLSKPPELASQDCNFGI